MRFPPLVKEVATDDKEKINLASEQFLARRGQRGVRRSLEELPQEYEQRWPG